MSDVFFTSDLHLFHPAMAWWRVTGKWPDEMGRKFITDRIVQDHNEHLAQAWDETVREGDHVWVLGDLTANNARVEAAMRWVKRRPGVKHLVLGNHDPAHPMHSDSHKWEWSYAEAFASLGIARSRKLTLPGGHRQRVLMSHFPYTGDGELKEDRGTQFRLRDEGLPILHGHVHTAERRTFAKTGNASTQIHVGVDAWGFKPVPLETITELLRRDTPKPEAMESTA